MEERDALKETVAAPEEKAEKTIETAFKVIRGSLSDEDVRPSVADLARLLELQGELAQLQLESLTVRWIDQCRQTADE